MPGALFAFGMSREQDRKVLLGNAKAPAQLFDKVRQGGSGNWGEVPMLAHPADKISDEDLKAAIAWILALE